MSGAGFLWLEKLTGSGIIRKAAKHNKREIQAELGAAGSINPKRSHLNYSIVGPAAAVDVGQLAKDLMATAGVVKNRKNGVLGIEVIFSLPPRHQVDDRLYFTACTEWAGRYFGGADNILSSDVHHDEAQLHCHILILPLRNGRMDASRMVGNTQNLLAMQDQFHSEVAQLFGLQKPAAKLSGAPKKAAAHAVLLKMRETGDSAMQSAAWANIRAAVENDPQPFLMTYGIELDAPVKKLKTMAQIFTSKGKGPSKERISIENFQAVKPNSLSLCREFPKALLPTSPKAEQAQDEIVVVDDFQEITRHHDCDQTSDRFDDSGDYCPRLPPAPRRHEEATRTALRGLSALTKHYG